MQLFAVLCVLLVAVAWGDAQGKYDHVDVDNILKNDRVVTQYVNCVLDKGPCTPQARDLKTALPKALATECSGCSEAEKTILRKASRHIMTKRPQDWEKIKNKFDPNGSHAEAFKKFMSQN